MFYNDPKKGYSLLGAYRVRRSLSGSIFNHARNFSSLAIRLRGKSRFSFHGKEILAEEKSVIYIPGGLEFTHIAEPEELIILHLQCHGTDENEITLYSVKGAEELFSALLAEWESARGASYQRCMSMLYRIFEALEAVQEPTQNIPPAIAEGVRYLHTHYREPGLTVTQLASLCHVSEVYFRRVFHACFAQSPLQYLLELRFAHACKLLRSGYYSTKEIASLSGFSDVKYFRTAFGQRFGCTPTEYAKEN